LLADAGKRKGKEEEHDDRAISELVRSRSDLRGLPLLLGGACRTTDKRNLAAMSEKALLARLRVARQPAASVWSKLREPDAAPALQQVMQTEDESERLYMVDALTRIRNRESSVALARRAVFDLSARVRREALATLRQRHLEDFRAVLAEGLRYPWAPAARHAAEALLALEDGEVINDLVAMLDLPDPEQPVQRSDGRWEKPQLVRVNHLRNCLLCHPPSTSESEPLRGQIPVPGKPLAPPVFYYQREDRDVVREFVRADVVYLRQDFSVKQPVKDHNVWPEMQRYDYMLRKQELTAEQAKAWSRDGAKSPQREAILEVLRGLTGMDAGDTGEAWKTALAAALK
jgi:hypothetical protein